MFSSPFEVAEAAALLAELSGETLAEFPTADVERAHGACRLAALAVAGVAGVEAAKARLWWTGTGIGAGLAVGIGVAGLLATFDPAAVLVQFGAIVAAAIAFAGGAWHERRGSGLLHSGEPYLVAAGRLAAELERRGQPPGGIERRRHAREPAD